MQFEWIASPITQCALLALGMLGCLALFVTMKLEIAVVRQSLEKGRSAMTTLPQADEPLLRVVPEPVGRNTQTISSNALLDELRRTQALQMQQQGESSAGISTTLRIPRNEIDLLLKIGRISRTLNPAGENPALH